MTSQTKSSGLFLVYLLGFLFAFHTALPTYINSSYLSGVASEKAVGLVYMAASLFTILCFLLMPYVLRRYGNYRTALFLVCLGLLTLLGLALLNHPVLLVILFCVNLITISLVYFSTDIFLEGFSSNQKTGRIRGIYLTAVNLAWAVSPLISGLLLTDNDYRKIYLASFVLLLPVALILVLSLRKFKDSKYEVVPLRKTMRALWRDKDLRHIFLANFLLFFFYSWMVIYTPLYLHQTIGFSWGTIGLIFFVMLLPFVLVQFPLGRLADKKWGEKEILSLGFVIMAISTGVISFINGQNVVLWAIILFLTRIGASTVEIMCDTYFFKKVDSLDANIISFFRMMSPLAYILGPLVGTIIFSYFGVDLKYLFLILGLLMLAGLYFSLSLRDTK